MASKKKLVAIVDGVVYFFDSKAALIAFMKANK